MVSGGAQGGRGGSAPAQVEVLPGSRCSSYRSPFLLRLPHSTTALPGLRRWRGFQLPMSRFDPRDFVADEDIPKIVVELERDAPALTVGYFIPDSALGTVTVLLEEKTCRDVDKAEEWRRELEAQGRAYIEISDSDESE